MSGPNLSQPTRPSVESAPSEITRHDDTPIRSPTHSAHDDADTNATRSGGATTPTVDPKYQLQAQTNYLPRKQVMLVFAGLSAGLFVSILDQSIVSTALPVITGEFNAGNQASWLSTSYLLTSTAASPLYGRFSDIFGRKTCMIFSLTVFLIGSVLCSAAQSITQLIVFRAISGIGGGAVITLVMVIVSDVVSLRERGTYQGVLGVVVAIGNSAGPLVGGSLASAGWRWCFIIAVPIIVLALVSVIFLLPLKKVDGDMKSKLIKVDYLGTFLVLAGSVLLLLGLNWGGQEYPWNSARVLVTLILGGFVLAAFFVVETKFAALPLVPTRLFRITTVASVMVQTLCSGGIFYLLLFFVPQFTQVVKGYSGVKAGVTLIPLMAVQAITSTVAGIIVSKTGRYKLIIIFGFAIFSVGVGLLARLNEHSSIGEIIGYLLLSGFGAGGTLQVTLVAAQNAVKREDLAVVTSMRNFIRLFGGTLSLAVCFTILNNTVQSHLPDVSPETLRSVVRDPTRIQSGAFDENLQRALLAAYVAAFRNVFFFGLALILCAFFVTLFFTKELPLDKKDDEQLKQEGKRWVQERKMRKKQRASQDPEVQHSVRVDNNEKHPSESS